jgi:hypothetical protein
VLRPLRATKFENRNEMLISCIPHLNLDARVGSRRQPHPKVTGGMPWHQRRPTVRVNVQEVCDRPQFTS